MNFVNFSTCRCPASCPARGSDGAEAGEGWDVDAVVVDGGEDDDDDEEDDDEEGDEENEDEDDDDEDDDDELDENEDVGWRLRCWDGGDGVGVVTRGRCSGCDGDDRGRK